MDDSKRGLNLVSTSIANIKNDLLGLANILETQVLPKINKMAQGLQSARILGPNGQPISSSNSVAYNGTGAPSPAPAGGGGGGQGPIADNGVRGGGGMGRAGAVLSGTIGFGNFISNAMPNVQTAVRQDLLTGQSAFYGQGGFGGTLGQQSANVRALQNALANRGIATNAMDTTQALAMAQSLGLSGAGNFNQVMMGAGTASNFAPGIGVSGAMRAMGTMNAPSTVNMLQTVGIRVRGPNGDVLPIPQIVEQLWNLITQNGKVPLSQRDIQIGLMPGNGLYGMLTSLYGDDEMTFTLVSNMLLAKAKSGGRLNLATADRADLEKMGLTSATVNKMARQTAGQTRLLTTTASAEAAGYGFSADLGNAMNNFAAAAGPLTQALAAFSGGYTGTMGLGNGSMGSIIKSIAGLLSGGNILSMFRADGGPVDGSVPYIVGERGPELFVPTSNGVIVPNHKLNDPTRADGEGGLTAGGMKVTNPTDFAKKLISGLGGTPTEQSINNVLMWYGKEGGNWNNTARFNPLNTSLQLEGSVNYNSLLSPTNRNYKSPGASGVQAYTSWEQGIQATIETLTGKSANERGYTGLVNALVGGGVSQKEFLKLMQASHWDANRYGGAKVGSTSSTTGSGSGTSDTSSVTTVASSADYTARIQSLLATSASALGGGGAAVGGSSVTYNNGPLTININGAGNTKQVAIEVQKILEDKYRVGKTGSS